MVAVMTALALRAIPPSPKSSVFLWWAGWERRTNAGSCALGIRRLPPDPLQNVWKSNVFFHASERDRRGPVGDVRLARAEGDIVECW